MPKPTAAMIAASAFVCEVDGGGPMNDADRQILRDALNALVCGADPQEVFDNQPRPSHTTTSRKFIIAVYVESRRRVCVGGKGPPPMRGQGRTPLARAKGDAVGAFNWREAGVGEPADAIQKAWKAQRAAASILSDPAIAHTLKKWELGSK